MTSDTHLYAAYALTMFGFLVFAFLHNFQVDWATPLGLDLLLGRYGMPCTIPAYSLVGDVVSVLTLRWASKVFQAPHI